jgi:hypothetical protein
MANKISVLIDVAVDGANRSLGSFKKSIQDADGAAGKFKAGASGAMDSIKANAGNLAMAGGAALVAFGVKAVGAFQETALEAGRLGESLGLSSEQASRFMEVAGDLGIETATLEKSIGKMNVEVAKSPAYFESLGIEIAKNADGSTDVQQTFLNVVDAIDKMPNATDRAAAAQKLLGKGWKDMAELVGGGSDKLKASLDAVSDAKVIDASEVEKARNFREAMDTLADSAEDFALLAGELLVPALTKAAETTEKGRNAFGKLDDALGPVDESLTRLVETNWKYLNPVGQAITAIGLFGDEADDSTDATRRYEEAISRQSDASAIQAALTDEATEATESSTEAIDESWAALERQRNAQEAANNAILEGLNSSLAYRNQQARTSEAIVAATATTGDMAQASRDAEGAVLDQAAAAVKLAEDQAAATGATLSAEQKAATFKAELEKLAGFLTGDALAAVQGYINQLNRIPRTVDTKVNFAGGGGSLKPAGYRASGGPVSAGGAYVVGERGPELLQMGSTSGNVVPNNKLGGVNVTINAGLGTNPIELGRVVQDALNKYARSGGR